VASPRRATVGSDRHRRVRYSDVQAWVADMSAERGAVIVETAYSVLARILDDAASDRLLTSNVEQLQRLADESGRYRSLVLLLGVGGLRWGEAAALRVGDIDFLRRRIELHSNAVTVGRQAHVGALKSNRTARWRCPRLSSTRSRRPPKARPATNCCGLHRAAAISPRPPHASHGCPTRQELTAK
jgi:integrase